MSPIFTGSKFGFSRPIISTVSGDPYFSNVSLLLHMNGVNLSTTFIDSSSNGLTSVISNNGASIRTDNSKFGGASCRFGGNQYLTSAYNSVLDLNGNNFTAETWIYPFSISASGSRIIASGGGTIAFNSTNGMHWFMQLVNTGNLQLQIYTTIGGAGLTSTATVSANTWSHVAVCVNGSTAYTAVNGVVESGNIGTVQRPSTNPTLGVGLIPDESPGSGRAFYGYMDDLRITKGIARYISNFTIPTSEFPNS